MWLAVKSFLVLTIRRQSLQVELENQKRIMAISTSSLNLEETYNLIEEHG